MRRLLLVLALMGCGERSEVSARDTGTNAIQPCDSPETGEGCPSGQRCVWQIIRDVDSGGCMPITGENILYEPCSRSAQDCAAGFACLNVRGADQQECFKVCNTLTNRGCEGTQLTCSITIDMSVDFRVCG